MVALLETHSEDQAAHVPLDPPAPPHSPRRFHYYRRRSRELSALTTPEPVTADDLAVLYDPRRGRYYCTHRPDPCSRKWRARVCKRVNLPGQFLTDRDAACAVVRWLRAWYGPDWRAAFRHMRANRGYVRRCVYPGCEPYWIAVVFVRGLPVLVKGRWGTEAEAQAALKMWLAAWRARYGRFAGLLLWRA